MPTQYENQGGLLVIPGTNQCAGYIFNFEGRGGYDPTGKVETTQGPTKEEIDAHNAILAKAEREAMIQKGKATRTVLPAVVSKSNRRKANHP